MKTTYLVWKDPSCNGINPEWEQISRNQFLALVKSPEGNGRRFVKLASTDEDGDGRIVIEATEQEFKSWLKEKRHAQHLRDSDPGYTLLSYHARTSEDEDCNGEELLSDESVNIEDDCLMMMDKQTLKAALACLTSEERELLALFYEQGISQPVIAKTLGISQQAVSKRLNKILIKLRNKNF
jgi:RNA polymerase sigma factor (sigma-70 family)